MEIQIGIAKVGKYAVGGSGDSVEIVERPRGGLSVVVVDGQGHGRAAKRISHQIASRAAALIGDGARDGVTMRSINDFLFAARDGQVSATVTVLTADLDANEVVVSRNTNSPVMIAHGDGSTCLNEGAHPIGVRRENRPAVSQWPLCPGMVLVGFTDGVVHAGRYGGGPAFSLDHACRVMAELPEDPQQLADSLLGHAISIEHGKPRDDMVVAVLAICDKDAGLGKRTMTVRYPF